MSVAAEHDARAASDLDDVALLKAVGASGSGERAESYFEELARRVSRPLRNSALRLLEDPDLADEIVQDTLLRIRRLSPSQVDQAMDSVLPWMFAIQRRVARDWRRSRESRPREVGHLFEDAAGEDAAAVEVEDAVPAQFVNPLARAPYVNARDKPVMEHLLSRGEISYERAGELAGGGLAATAVGQESLKRIRRAIRADDPSVLLCSNASAQACWIATASSFTATNGLVFNAGEKLTITYDGNPETFSDREFLFLAELSRAGGVLSERQFDQVVFHGKAPSETARSTILRRTRTKLETIGFPWDIKESKGEIVSSPLPELLAARQRLISRARELSRGVEIDHLTVIGEACVAAGSVVVVGLNGEVYVPTRSELEAFVEIAAGRRPGNIEAESSLRDGLASRGISLVPTDLSRNSVALPGARLNSRGWLIRNDGLNIVPLTKPAARLCAHVYSDLSRRHFSLDVIGEALEKKGARTRQYYLRELIDALKEGADRSLHMVPMHNVGWFASHTPNFAIEGLQGESSGPQIRSKYGVRGLDARQYELVYRVFVLKEQMTRDDALALLVGSHNLGRAAISFFVDLNDKLRELGFPKAIFPTLTQVVDVPMDMVVRGSLLLRVYSHRYREGLEELDRSVANSERVQDEVADAGSPDRLEGPVPAEVPSPHDSAPMDELLSLVGVKLRSGNELVGRDGQVDELTPDELLVLERLSELAEVSADGLFAGITSDGGARDAIVAQLQHKLARAEAGLWIDAWQGRQRFELLCIGDTALQSNLRINGRTLHVERVDNAGRVIAATAEPLSVRSVRVAQALTEADDSAVVDLAEVARSVPGLDEPAHDVAMAELVAASSAVSASKFDDVAVEETPQSRGASQRTRLRAPAVQVMEQQAPQTQVPVEVETGLANRVLEDARGLVTVESGVLHVGVRAGASIPEGVSSSFFYDQPYVPSGAEEAALTTLKDSLVAGAAPVRVVTSDEGIWGLRLVTRPDLSRTHEQLHIAAEHIDSTKKRERLTEEVARLQTQLWVEIGPTQERVPALVRLCGQLRNRVPPDGKCREYPPEHSLIEALVALSVPAVCFKPESKAGEVALAWVQYLADAADATNDADRILMAHPMADVSNRTAARRDARGGRVPAAAAVAHVEAQLWEIVRREVDTQREALEFQAVDVALTCRVGLGMHVNVNLPWKPKRVRDVGGAVLQNIGYIPRDDLGGVRIEKATALRMLAAPMGKGSPVFELGVGRETGERGTANVAGRSGGQRRRALPPAGERRVADVMSAEGNDEEYRNGMPRRRHDHKGEPDSSPVPGSPREGRKPASPGSRTLPSPGQGQAS